MKTDPLQQFIALRSALTQERARVAKRLAEIDRALEIVPPKVAERAGASRADNKMSLREYARIATKDKPLTKPEILKAVAKLGYKFTAKDPKNSLNVTLYTPGNFKNCGDGRFQALKK